MAGVLVLLLLATLALAGCGQKAAAPKETDNKQPEAKPPTADQGLVVRRDSDGESLDPALTTAMADYMALQNIYGALVRFKPGTFELEPDLATKWEVSPDGTTYTFTLRQGVKFQKGFGEFTSEDVKFTIERILDPKTKSKNADQFKNVKEIQTPDKYTVKIVLSKPNPTFLYSVAATRPVGGFIVSKKAIEKFGADSGTNPIGTGPFQLREWVKREKLVLEPNPDYYAGAPKLSQVTFVVIPDETTSNLAVEKGTVHISEVYDPEAIKRYKASSDIAVMKGPRASIHMLMLNTKAKPFDDVRVRQAMAYAINTSEIIDGLLGGYATKPASPIHPAMQGFTGDVKKYEYNPQKAKELLAQAGLPNGFKTSVATYPYGMWGKILELVQGQLAQVGIQMEINSVERGTYVEIRAKETTPIVMFGQSTPPDPDATFKLFESASIPPKGLNLSRYAGADDDIKAARVEIDDQKRAEIQARVQKKLIEDVPAVPLYHPDWTFLARKSVKGYTVEPFGGIWLYPITVESK